MKVWVLTREISAYDQEGEYFEAVFLNRPTFDQLISKGVPQHKIRHVMNGGGWYEGASAWFNLTETELK